MGFVSWRRGWLRNIHRGWNYGTWQVKFNFVTCGLLWSAQTGLWGTGCGFFSFTRQLQTLIRNGNAVSILCRYMKNWFQHRHQGRDGPVLGGCAKWATVLQRPAPLLLICLIDWLIVQSVKHHKVVHISKNPGWCLLVCLLVFWIPNTFPLSNVKNCVEIKKRKKLRWQEGDKPPAHECTSAKWTMHTDYVTESERV